MLDDIRVEYHPNSGRGTRFYRFVDFAREWSAGLTSSDPLSEKPHDPFKSLEDFLFAELVLDRNLKKEHVELLLDLINRDRPQPVLSFTSAKDIDQTWNKAALFHPQVSMILLRIIISV